MSLSNIFFGVCFGLLSLFLLAIARLVLHLHGWIIAFNFIISGSITWWLWHLVLSKLEAYHNRKIDEFRGKGILASSFDAIPENEYFFILDKAGKRYPDHLQIKLSSTTYTHWRKKTGYESIRILAKSSPVEYLTPEEHKHFRKLA